MSSLLSPEDIELECENVSTRDVDENFISIFDLHPSVFSLILAQHTDHEIEGLSAVSPSLMYVVPK